MSVDREGQLLLATIILFVGLLIILSSRRATKNRTTPDQQHDENTAANHQVVPVTKSDQSPPHQERSKYRYYCDCVRGVLTNRDNWIVFSTVILAISTSVLAYIAFNTDSAVHESAKAASDANKLNAVSQRAWVAITGFAFADLMTASANPLKVRITYQNVGREPARNVRSRVRTSYIPEAPIPSSVWGDLPIWHTDETFRPKAICDDISLSTISIVLYPTTASVNNLYTSDEIVNKLSVDDVKDRSNIYIVKGCFSYTSLDRVRYTSYCAYLSPLDGKDISQWLFAACPIGNDDWGRRRPIGVPLRLVGIVWPGHLGPS
jgi:hypothetical protein